MKRHELGATQARSGTSSGGAMGIATCHIGADAAEPLAARRLREGPAAAAAVDACASALALTCSWYRNPKLGPNGRITLPKGSSTDHASPSLVATSAPASLAAAFLLLALRRPSLGALSELLSSRRGERSGCSILDAGPISRRCIEPCESVSVLMSASRALARSSASERSPPTT